NSDSSDSEIQEERSAAPPRQPPAPRLPTAQVGTPPGISRGRALRIALGSDSSDSEIQEERSAAPPRQPPAPRLPTAQVGTPPGISRGRALRIALGFPTTQVGTPPGISRGQALRNALGLPTVQVGTPPGISRGQALRNALGLPAIGRGRAQIYADSLTQGRAYRPTAEDERLADEAFDQLELMAALRRMPAGRGHGPPLVKIKMH
ncbi:uncharacterized protein LOC112463871, partial [Temnothorax curvispinosus]|uniref:Uncharacterized protein LOC112463871 n=1 Tax=Temnothorax curvispinosus TaxID=300111 RepID=A0A6J1QZK1_9HYME